MNLDQAIQKGRALDFAAREGWPQGMPLDLAEQASLVLGVIDGKIAAVPVDERPALAASIKAKLSGRTFKATVQPKRATA